MDKKYQVFLSSTYKDLKEERNHAIISILKANCIPVGMEMFPATGQEPLEYIKKVIDYSDYYLIIIGGSYGSEYQGISFTEHELNYAQSKNKKIIAFIQENPVFIDKGEKLKKLKKLIITLQKDFIVKRWLNIDQLGESILHSLVDLKANTPQEGWVKLSPENLREISKSQNKRLLEKNQKLQHELSSAKKINTNLDLKYEAQNFRKIIEQKLKEIDKKANKIIGSHIISSRTGKDILFSSEKIAISLSLLGIPFYVSYEIIDSCLLELETIKKRKREIYTSDIRKAVSETLYKMQPDKIISKKRIQLWTDNYIRKYGDPDRQIQVLNDTGDFKEESQTLSYSLIKDYVLKDVIKEIYPSNYSDRLNSLRSEDSQAFGEEIIQHVKYLEIYEIQYSTLICLSKEVSLSIPHPWFTREKDRAKIINYDLSKAIYHSDRLNSIMTSETFSYNLHSLRECLHHSCSGILNLYDIIPGISPLSPFHNLIYHLNNLYKNNKQSDFIYGKLELLTNDLKIINNIEVNYFIEYLELIRSKLNFLENKQTPNILNLVDKVINLKNIFINLSQKNM